MMSFTKIARDKRLRPRARRLLPQRSRRPARGQILPMVAGGMMAFVLFATLLIDGAMMMQAHRDLEVIAQHAANVGAQKINFNSAAYTSNCRFGLDNADRCSDSLKLDVPAATAAAASIASTWITRNESQALSIPGFAPSTGSIVTNKTNRNRLEITVRRCYRPFLINIFTANNGDGCTGATLISVTAIARPIGGN